MLSGLQLGAECGLNLVNVHFFGGEPFVAADVVRYSVAYASRLAEQNSMERRFEVTTNGAYSHNLAYWIADQFDTVVLSLDGPARIQEYHRPSRNRRPLFPIVYRNAKIFSKGNCELVLRVCVTEQTVSELPEIAKWMADEFHPTIVSLETIHSSPKSISAGLREPDPLEFARQFYLATEELGKRGIEAILSTADVNKCQTSFCPVGKNALIVSPTGEVNACYLPEKNWQSAGLNLRLGKVEKGRFWITSEAVERVQAFSRIENDSRCSSCLCRYHCAGGCSVRRYKGEIQPGVSQCIQTRLVTVTVLLQMLGESGLASNLLRARDEMERIAFQATDLLCDQEWEW